MRPNPTAQADYGLLFDLRRSVRYQSLRARFITLEAALLADPAANHHIARLHIEADEPPIYRALDLLCHNEQMRADGHPPDSEHWASVPLYQCLTCHLFRWPDLAA